MRRHLAVKHGKSSPHVIIHVKRTKNGDYFDLDPASSMNKKCIEDLVWAKLNLGLKMATIISTRSPAVETNRDLEGEKML
jgi:hypothetical protein